MSKNKWNDEGYEIRIVLAVPWDKEHAVIETRDFAAHVGFSKNDQAVIAIAASELSSNILRYAEKGELLLRQIRENGRVGIEVLATDRGPGIANVERAMQDHYTTSKGSLGLGLPSVRRIMDEFEIESTIGKGTRILARKWRGVGER